MKKKGRYGSICLSVFLGWLCFLCLAACGEKKGIEEEGSNEGGDLSVNYEMEYAEGDVQGEITHFHFGGGRLYRSEQEGKVSKIYVREANAAEDELVFATEKGQRLLDFATLSDGRIVAAILVNSGAEEGKAEDDTVSYNRGNDRNESHEGDSGNNNEEGNQIAGTDEWDMVNATENTMELSLQIYDAAGTLQKEVALPEMDGINALARLRVTQDDAIVIALDRCACMLREDGTVLWQVRDLEFLVSGVYALEDGAVILSELSEQGIILNNVSSDGRLSRQTGVVPSYVKLVDSERGLYGAGSGCIYRVEETGDRIEVLSLASQGISSTLVEAVSKEGATYGLCLYDWSAQNTFQLATLQEKEGAVEKKVLTLAITIKDEFIARTPMGTFNMRSKTHRIAEKTYSDDGEAREAQIDASMMTEDAPDLLCIWGQEKYENYALKGALMDITDLIPREDYLERTLKDFTVNGSVYGFPKSFGFYTLVCANENLEGRTMWNVEQFLDFMEKHPNAFMNPYDTPESEKKELLYTALKRGIYEFIDFEKGVATFDSREFRSVLERIDKLNISAVTQSKYERSQGGEVVLWETYFSSPGELQLAAAEVGQGREFTLIGYPDGKNGSGGVLNYSMTLSINDKTEEADAAREFFGDWLKAGDAWSKYYFPITKRGFEEVISRAKEATYQKDADGNLVLDENGNPVEEGQHYGLIDSYAGYEIWYDVFALTDAQEGMLRKAVDTCVNHSNGEDSIIRKIILEEAKPYFAGQVGLDATVDKIQGRVQLILNEDR